MFDVWIAGAVTGTGERIGVVWRGPPAGDEEGGEFDGDDGIAEWHFIDGGDARHVRWDWEGVGEGWVEWVEGRRGGLFVVHDVFR